MSCNWKKARENPFQYPKVGTTWQLLSDYRGWTWLYQPNPKTPSKKTVVTAKQFHTRILQRRGIGSERMNQQLNSLFRSREAAASLSWAVCHHHQRYSMEWFHLGNKARLLWTKPWKNHMIVNLIRAIKIQLIELLKIFNLSTLSRAGKPAESSLCDINLALLSQVTVMTVQGAPSLASTLLMSRNTHRMRWY